MKGKILAAMALGAILAPCALVAQVPAGAPAGTTGKCRDGSFSSSPKKSGACRGHKGVDTWYAAAAPAAAAPAKAASQPAPVQSTAMTPAPAETPAPTPAPPARVRPRPVPRM